MDKSREVQTMTFEAAKYCAVFIDESSTSDQNSSGHTLTCLEQMRTRLLREFFVDFSKLLPAIREKRKPLIGLQEGISDHKHVVL